MKLNVKLEIDGVGTITEYKGVTMEYLLKSLKSFQSSIVSNEIEGTKVFGKHTNSRNVKTSPDNFSF
jgi:hypothetical protein